MGEGQEEVSIITAPGKAAGLVSTAWGCGNGCVAQTWNSAEEKLPEKPVQVTPWGAVPCSLDQTPGSGGVREEQAPAGAGAASAYLRSGPSPFLWSRWAAARASWRCLLTGVLPFSPLPPSLLLLGRHSLSGLMPSICCNHECIQITTLPCAAHV